jgi:hypothetical protein
MTVSGVGAVVALSYVEAVDDPARFAKSKAVGLRSASLRAVINSARRIGEAPSSRPAMPERGARWSKQRTP